MRALIPGGHGESAESRRWSASRRRGFTLVETSTALLLASLGAAAVLPPALRFGDHLRLNAAREALAAVIAEGRGRAIETGSAEITVANSPWRVWVETPDSSYAPLALADFGVAVSLGTGGNGLPRSSRTLRFNSLGLGSVASQTITLSRGPVSKELVISSYGRVKRK